MSMMGLGKIIAAFLGYFLMGPLGALLGLFIGHQFDVAYANARSFGGNDAEHQRIQSIFFTTTFQIMGYVAKADGSISENEIQTARRVMDKMGLTEAQRQDAMRSFTEGKQANFNVEQALFLLKQNCWRQPALLRMFIEIQFQAAYAEGHINPRKNAALNRICQYLGSRVNFGDFQYGFGGEREHQRSRKSYASSVSRLDEAYALLGISHTATDADVKRAYRRQMSQNHPDKLIAKGLPDAMMKLATEKTQKIQAAYEQICAARS